MRLFCQLPKALLKDQEALLSLLLHMPIPPQQSGAFSVPPSKKPSFLHLPKHREAHQ